MMGRFGRAKPRLLARLGNHASGFLRIPLESMKVSTNTGVNTRTEPDSERHRVSSGSSRIHVGNARAGRCCVSSLSATLWIVLQPTGSGALARSGC